MNVKTLILGVVMGGMIAAGTYSFVPTPSGAYAKAIISQELEEAVAELKRHQCAVSFPTTRDAIIPPGRSFEDYVAFCIGL